VHPGRDQHEHLVGRLRPGGKPVPGPQASPDGGISETEAEMAVQPEIVQCTEQPYVAVRAPAAIQTLGEVLPGLHPKSRRWLRSQGVQSAGQPFSKKQEKRHRHGPAASDRGLLPGRCPGSRPRPGAHGFRRPADTPPCGIPVTRTGCWSAQPEHCLAGPRRPWPGRYVHARWRAARLPPRDLSRRTQAGHERVGNRAPHSSSPTSAAPGVLRGADSVSAAGRCCSIWCCRGQE
jgi:hypothetical protein